MKWLTVSRVSSVTGVSLEFFRGGWSVYCQAGVLLMCSYQGVVKNAVPFRDKKRGRV
jgi:hypothetical protein